MERSNAGFVFYSLWAVAVNCVGFFSPPVDLVLGNAGQFTPPLCLEDLDLGGFVTLQNPKIIAVEIDGDPEFQEYIGITGGVAPAP